MKSRIAVAITVVAMAGPSVAAPLTIANPTSDRLAQINDLYRRGALRSAIIDSGYPCIRVEQTAIQGPWANLMMWRAKCSLTDPRFDYAVFIGPDASIEVRYCANMAELKLPACRPLVARPKGRSSR